MKWLFVVVDGPSEVKDDAHGAERIGAVTKIIEQVFGEECAKGSSFQYSHHVRLSPLREERRPRGYKQAADLEAWLLADPELLAEPLPAGKRCEELWGARRDASSNHPKHVLERCVLSPKGWTLHDAVKAWDLERARSQARSLDEFLNEVEALAKQHDI